MPTETDTGPQRIWIEIETSEGSIAGTLHRGEEPVRPFHGWLELVALLEETCAPSAPQGDVSLSSDGP
jgi:hypothetical protein